MRAGWLVLAWAAAGCTEAVPPVCADTCAVRAERAVACPEGAALEEAVAADPVTATQDVRTGCETWVWSLIRLERDAGARGSTVAMCAEHGEALASDDDPCAVHALDWSSRPW